MQTSGRRFHYGYVIVFMGVLSTIGAIGLARLGYSLILPGMKEGLGLSFAQTGQIATGNFVGYLVMAAGGGALAARYGPRVMVSGSAAVCGLALICTGLAPNFWTAFALRFVTGLGSGGMNVPMMGALAAWFGTRRRGAAAGIVAGGSSVALIVSGEYLPRILSGDGLGPVAAANEGWRLGWFAIGSFVLLVAVLTGLFLRNRPDELGLQPIGVQRGSAEHAFRAGVTMRWTHMLRSTDLWRLALLYGLFGFAYIVFFTFFAAHLRDRGLGLEEAGAMWGWLGWISLPSSFLWGWVSDSVGRKYGLATVYLLLGLACFVFAAGNSRAWYFVALALYGLGGWAVPGIMAAASGDYVPPRLAPAALGMITLVFGVGQAAGPWLAGYLRDSSGSFASSFYAAAVVAMIGVACALCLKPPKSW